MFITFMVKTLHNTNKTFVIVVLCRNSTYHFTNMNQNTQEVINLHELIRSPLPLTRSASLWNQRRVCHHMQLQVSKISGEKLPPTTLHM